MTAPLAVVGRNNLGALYSFLRVLATNVATALLPLFLSSGANADEYPAGKAVVIAVIVSVLLTLVNYFRAGNVSFGVTAPNVVREDGATDVITALVVVFLVIVVLIVLGIL